jgi:hypothetical protein
MTDKLFPSTGAHTSYGFGYTLTSGDRTEGAREGRVTKEAWGACAGTGRKV